MQRKSLWVAALTGVRQIGPTTTHQSRCCWIHEEDHEKANTFAVEQAAAIWPVRQGWTHLVHVERIPDSAVKTMAAEMMMTELDEELGYASGN